MNESLARQIAHGWLEAWNSHDLDAILSHYSDDVEFMSPFVVRLAGVPDGTLRGQAALRDYFSRGLAAYPDLSFDLLQVLPGVNSLTLLYRSVKNLLAAETMSLGAGNKIVRVQAHYAEFASRLAETVTQEEREAREWRRGDYLLTDDRRRVDLAAVCALLHDTYWADDRPREVIEKSLRHSVVLSLLHAGRQVGLIRGVTDHSTFTWVCDVVVHPDHRGGGLGRWMVECFLQHPATQTISQHLCTKDAHGLYEPFGFKRIEAMRRSTKPLPFLLV